MKGGTSLKHKIQLSEHFTIPKLLLFALPSIGMQLVDNTYMVADGYFISNYIGELAFGAENLIFPPLFIVISVGTMFGSGASALLSREMGEGRHERANRWLTLIILTLAVLGVILSVAAYLLMPTIARWVGAPENMVADCVTYGRTLAFFMPFQMLGMAFHPLMIAAERPTLGLGVTIASAAANILMDWLFVAVFHWGLTGAALATGLTWLVGAAIPFFFFLRKNSLLHFLRPQFSFRTLGTAMYNGASEMVDASAYAIVALTFNLQMLRYLGDAGVEAYAVSEYVAALFASVFFGISMSIVPVVGYHLGQENWAELRSLRKKGFLLMGVFGVLMTASALALAVPIARLYVGYNDSLTALATTALRITSPFFLFMGFTTYSASYFTGLNQGTASLIISVMKSFIGPLSMVYLLPLLMGSNGLWAATPSAEVLALIATVCCFIVYYRKNPQVAEGKTVTGKG